MTNKNPQKYLSLSTYELLLRIVEHSDRDVLNHLMEFRRIIHHGETWILIPEYILYLSLNRIPINDFKPELEDYEAFEQRVNDLTRARFLEFAKKNTEGKGCLKQYSHILETTRSSECLESSIKMEQLISAELKKSIWQHFKYCINEGQRQINPFQKRYEWWREGKKHMILYRPTTIDTSIVSRWLNESFPVIDDTDPEFKEKVQQALDQRFGSGFFVRINELYNNGHQKFEPTVEPKGYDESPDYRDIIMKIVQRKDLEFEELRPGIQKLGRERMKELVVDILESNAKGKYEQNKIAKAFGISKSTMSRFSGTKWQIGQAGVPDLWQNAIRVILTKPEFVEFAAENGLERVIRKLTVYDTRDQ
ncbi:hypothetical protein ACFL47_08300 [Candidatus Latescibacterota bacterium]